MNLVDLRSDGRWAFTASMLGVVVLALVTQAAKAAVESPELLALSLAFLLTVEIPLFVWLVFLRSRGTLPILVAMSSVGVLVARVAVVDSESSTTFLGWNDDLSFADTVGPSCSCHRRAALAPSAVGGKGAQGPRLVGPTEILGRRNGAQ